MTEKIPVITVIHGPNLNLLGLREPEIYGTTTLGEINDALLQKGTELGVAVETFQSNHEGALVDRIQKAREKTQGLIINPAAYTHTSVAIRDALLTLEVPIMEVHLSNIFKREAFRHHSHVSDIALALLSGFGKDGYFMALEAMVRVIKG